MSEQSVIVPEVGKLILEIVTVDPDAVCVVGVWGRCCQEDIESINHALEECDAVERAVAAGKESFFATAQYIPADPPELESYWDINEVPAPAPGNGWEETARQYANGLEYYRGLVVQIGEMFGVAAKTADDGGIHEDVLCAKVPELVRAALVPAPGVCVWEEQDPDGSEPGTWNGACGAVWYFEDGGPEDGDCNFCPKCGNRIEARAYQPEESK